MDIAGALSESLKELEMLGSDLDGPLPIFSLDQIQVEHSYFTHYSCMGQFLVIFKICVGSSVRFCCHTHLHVPFYDSLTLLTVWKLEALIAVIYFSVIHTLISSYAGDSHRISQ